MASRMRILFALILPNFITDASQWVSSSTNASFSEIHFASVLFDDDSAAIEVMATDSGRLPTKEEMDKYGEYTISVAVPVVPSDFHEFETITLPSISRQTYFPEEIVVAVSSIEDSKVEDLKKKWQDLVKDIPLKVVATDQKQYPGENRNAAVKPASGKYIVFQDSDDSMHPRRVELVKCAFGRYGPKIVLHGYHAGTDVSSFLPQEFDVLTLSHTYENNQKNQGEDQGEDLGNKRYSVHQGQPSVKKSVFDDVRQNDGMERGEDVNFLRRVTDYYKGSDGKTMVYLGLPLVGFSHYNTGR